MPAVGIEGAQSAAGRSETEEDDAVGLVWSPCLAGTDDIGAVGLVLAPCLTGAVGAVVVVEVGDLIESFQRDLLSKEEVSPCKESFFLLNVFRFPPYRIEQGKVVGDEPPSKVLASEHDLDLGYDVGYPLLYGDADMVETLRTDVFLGSVIFLMAP